MDKKCEKLFNQLLGKSRAGANKRSLFTGTSSTADSTMSAQNSVEPLKFKTPRARGSAVDAVVQKTHGTRSSSKARGHNPAVNNSLGASLCTVSLGECFEAMLRSHKLSAEEKCAINWHRANLEMSNGADLRKLSNEEWDQDDIYAFEGDHSAIKGGFTQIVQALEMTVDIQYGYIVEEIIHDQQRVRIKGLNMPEIEADAVVVTVPLGILKAGSICFNPPLPPRKVAAINRLGYGSLLKVALHFERSFWDSIDFVGYASQRRGRFPILIDGSPIYGKPILVVMTTGEEADFMEQKSDAWIRSRLLKVLRNIYGDSSVPEPLFCHITRWRSDRLSRGTYSYIPPRSSGRDYDILSLPVFGGKSIMAGVDPASDHSEEASSVAAEETVASLQPSPRSRRQNRLRLFFAGEATNRYFPATAHGAFLSGIREAQLLHRHYEFNETPQAQHIFNRDGEDGMPDGKVMRERVHVRRSFRVSLIQQQLYRSPKKHENAFASAKSASSIPAVQEPHARNGSTARRSPIQHQPHQRSRRSRMNRRLPSRIRDDFHVPGWQKRSHSDQTSSETLSSTKRRRKRSPK